MKRTIALFFIIIGLQNVAFAQQQAPAVVANNRLQLLYYQIENPVQIAVSDIPPSEIVIETENAEMTNLGNGNYTIKPTEFEMVNLTVYWIDNGVKKMLSKEHFYVAFAPVPGISLGGVNQGIYTAEEIIALNKIEVPPVLPIDYEVLYFGVVAVVGDSLQMATNRADTLSNEQKDLIRQAQAGTKVYFGEFRVQTPENKVHSAPAFGIYKEGKVAALQNMQGQALSHAGQKDLLESRKLIVSMFSNRQSGNYVPLAGFKIRSFDLLVENQDTTIVLKSKSRRLTRNMKKLLETLPAEQPVLLTNIVARSKEGETIELPDYVIGMEQEEQN